MNKCILMRWVAVAALASLPLPPGFTQHWDPMAPPPGWDPSTSFFGGPFPTIIDPAMVNTLIQTAHEIDPTVFPSSIAGLPITEVPAIRNAPVTQNFIQLAQPEEPTTDDMNYASPTYSATDLQGDLGDSDVSEDSE